MDPEVLDLSKENIQPLKQGRLTNHLGIALQAETDREAHLQLVKERENFEILIRTYEGDDPLDLWFRYVLWIEQTYLKHGREGNLQVLLERCISHFKDVPHYQQDIRFVELCIKFIEMSSSPLELYKQCHASGIGTGCTLFYISWAFALECSADMKRANQVLEEGLKSQAWPLDQMRDAHQRFQLRVAKQVLSEGGNDMRREAEEEHREVLARLHHRMGGVRIAQGKTGVLQVHGQIKKPSNAVTNIYIEDDTGENKEFAAVPNCHVPAMPRRTTMNKENIQQPAPWVTKQPRHRPQATTTTVIRTRAQNPEFQLHHDEEECPPSTPSSCISNALKPRKLDEDRFHCPLAIFEPPDPTMRPMYCKDKVYAGGTEFSFDELRAIAYLKGKLPKWKRVVVKEDQNAELQQHKDIRQKDNFECPIAVFESPDPTKVVQYCKNKVYQGNTEFSFEELRAKIYLNGTVLPGLRKAESNEENRRDDFSCPLAVFESPNPKLRPMYRKSEVYADNTEYSFEELKARDPKYQVNQGAMVGRVLNESMTVTKLFGEELHKWNIFVAADKDATFSNRDEDTNVARVHNDSLMVGRRLKDLQDLQKNVNVSATCSSVSSITNLTVNFHQLYGTPSSAFESHNFGKNTTPSINQTRKVSESQTYVADNAILSAFCPYVDSTDEIPKQTLSEISTPTFNLYADENSIPQQRSTRAQGLSFNVYKEEDPTKEQCIACPDTDSILPNKGVTASSTQEEPSEQCIAKDKAPSFCNPTDISQPLFTPYENENVAIPQKLTTKEMDETDGVSVQSISKKTASASNAHKLKTVVTRRPRAGRKSALHGIPGFPLCLHEADFDAVQNSVEEQVEGVSPQQMTKQSPNHSFTSFTANTKEAQHLMEELWRDLEVKPTAGNTSEAIKDIEEGKVDQQIMNGKPELVHPNFEIFKDKSDFSLKLGSEEKPIAENTSEAIKDIEERKVDEQITNGKSELVHPNFEIFKDNSDFNLKLGSAGSEIPHIPSPGMSPLEELFLLGTDMKENVCPKDCVVPQPLQGPLAGTLQLSTRVVVDNNDAFEDNEVTCNTAAFNFPLPSSTPLVTHIKKDVPVTEENTHPVYRSCLRPSINLSVITEVSEGKSSGSSGSSAASSTMRHTTIQSCTQSSLPVIQGNRNIQKVPACTDPKERKAVSISNADVVQKLDYDVTSDMSKLKIDQKQTTAENTNKGVILQPPEKEECAFNIDPFDKNMIVDLLKQMQFPCVRHKNRYTKLDCKVPIFKTRSSVTLGKDKFTIDCLLGEGSYAKVYKATQTKTNKTVALKLQKPAWEWEIYICREIQLRIADPLKALAFMDVNMAYILNNGSVIVTNCGAYGSLLSVINKFKVANETIPEVLALYWLAELIAMGNALRKCQIIHGDIKPDNFVLRVLPSSLEHNEPTLQLIDMGRGIDMKLFPPETSFNAVVTTQCFQCIEMLSGRPWTYQLDLFGIAATMHCILFKRYMQVLPTENNRWIIFKSMKRYPTHPLWQKFFNLVLNIESCSNLPDLDIFHNEVMEALHTFVKNDKKAAANFTKAITLIASK